MEKLNKLEGKIETVLFLPEEENRQGEGGLRSQGCFKESYHDKPLITVITVVYNGNQFLEETILSVINQTYDNVEYIIIDGGSIDGTLDIIKKYEHAIDYWVSEQDFGIYYAMNKGSSLATGEWINFMNCGDTYHNETVLENVSNQFLDAEINMLFGKSITFYKQFEKIRYLNFNSAKKDFYLTKMPNHQAIFIRSDIYKLNAYDITYKFSSDTEYLRRCFNGAKFQEVSYIISRFELGGVSSFYNNYKNFMLIVNDSMRLSGKKTMPFTKHFVKFLLQKILGKNLYLIFYITWLLK